MLGKLFKGQFKGLAKTPAEPPALPKVGEATLGRALRIDPSMLEGIARVTGEPVSPDLVVTGQGVVEMADEAGSTWLHRFYDDDHRMLQALTDSPEGGEAREWSFYVPAGTEHLAVGARRADWTKRLSSVSFAHEGEPYARYWYGEDEREQLPVRLVETVREAPGEAGRDVVQDCMVYGRETEAGEVLLLAIVLGEGDEAVFETMIGTGLRPHQIGV